MSIGELLAVLLFLVPVIGAAVVLIARRRSVTVGTVAVVSLVLTVSSFALLAYMASESFGVLTIEAQALYPMAPVLIVLDLALTALFLVIGWRIRSWFIAAVAAANLALTVLLGYWTNFAESGPALLIDNLALIMYYNLGCNGIGILSAVAGSVRLASVIEDEDLEPSMFDPELLSPEEDPRITGCGRVRVHHP